MPPPTAEPAAGAVAELAPPLLESAIWLAFIEPLASAGAGAVDAGAAASCASTRAADERGQAASSNAATAQTCTARGPGLEEVCVFQPAPRQADVPSHLQQGRGSDLMPAHLQYAFSRVPSQRLTLRHAAAPRLSSCEATSVTVRRGSNSHACTAASVAFSSDAGYDTTRRGCVRQRAADY